MIKEVFIATGNAGKIERFKNLIKSVSGEVKVYTPIDFGFKLDVAETGKTLAENAEIKARAYFGKVEMSILSNDTGFWVEGEGLVDTPKRSALGEQDENSLSREELSRNILQFWKGIAEKNGGQVNAAWIEAFVRLDPGGNMYSAESKREVILTDREFGETHIQLPIRALYISKATGKPAVLQTKEEEFLELRPITDALSQILAA